MIYQKYLEHAVYPNGAGIENTSVVECCMKLKNNRGTLPELVIASVSSEECCYRPLDQSTGSFHLITEIKGNKQQRALIFPTGAFDVRF